MEGASESNVLTDPMDSATCPKCGAMLDIEGVPPFSPIQCPSCEAEFQAPARFGAFVLLQLLGAGGMGGVYRALDEALNREVAIKVMLKSLGDDPQFVETFQREAQAAAQLNHRHIAQIYSFGQEKGQPYIAMELVSGGSLDKMITEQGPLTPAAAVLICSQIAEGLSMAADAGLVHGDIKPENILFDGDKNAKLVDFGLSAMQGGPGAEIWGTPYYIAPEKVRRQKVDHRSDIYSLGGTLYHAIAGVPPFEGEDATAVVKARFDGPPKPMREIRKGVPEEVETLVARMLEVEPQKRYPTYGSLLGDMRRYLAKAGPVRIDKGSKKIMIKGKGGGSMAGAQSTTGMASEVPPGMTPVADIEEEGESEEAARKRGCRMMMMLGLGGILLIGLLVGGFFGLKYFSAGKKTAAEMTQIASTQEKARVSIAKSVASAKTLAERMRGFVPDAMTYPKAAADEVVKALGEEARASMIPPEPDYAAEMEASVVSNAPPDTAAGGKITLEPAMIEQLVKQLPPELAEAVKGLDKLSPDQAFAKLEEVIKALPAEQGAELKQGIDMLKAISSGVGGAAMQQMAEGMAAAMGGAMQQMAEGMATAMGAAVAPAGEGAGITADAGGDAPPVIATVRGMYAEAYAVKKASLMADKVLAEIEQQAKGAEQFAAVTTRDAEELAKLNNALVERVNKLGYDRDISEAPRKVSSLKRTLESVKTEVESLITLKRIEKQEAEKRKKVEEEAEKKRQVLEAQNQKIADEKARVIATAASNADLLKQLQFRDALRVIKEMKDELETPEAQEVAAVAVERVNRLKDFHDYLVKKVPGFKGSRGWSITEADAKSLSVGNKKIPWTEIFESRMDIVGELVNGLVVDEKATRELRLREKTRLMTNAALCLSLFYPEVQSAQDLAKRLANDAAAQFDVDASDIKQLLPEFF